LNSAPIPAAATPAACRSIPSQSAVSTQNAMVESHATEIVPVLFNLRPAL
jgi:hypothetical protein